MSALTRLHRDRGVTPEVVSPSLAIPLLRAAYDDREAFRARVTEMAPLIRCTEVF
jgi:hypothetical protein